MEKPRLFIGSSSESYDVASACNVCLDRKVEVTIWDKIFEPGGDTLSSLLTKANNVDFALFIFTPDDLTNMRENLKPTVRDNVLFELGLFIGALGKERCFILKPRDEKLHMPTDLLGINTCDYAPNRGDGDMESAVNAACTRFITQIKKLGFFQRQSRDIVKVNSKKGMPEHQITDSMIKMMGTLLPTLTDRMYLNSSEFQSSIPDYKFNLSLIKLEKLNLIERVIDSDFNGNEWFGYKLTGDGGDYLLDNEDSLDKIFNPPQVQAIPKQYAEPPMNFDDDIPF